MVRTKQGGSVLSFVVVGALLLAVFAGGAYAVRHYTQPTEETPTELPGGPPQEEPQPEEKSPEQPAPDSRDESSQKQETKPEEATPQESGPQPDTSHEVAPPAEKGSGHATLPETGPAQLLAPLLAAGLLSATAVSYLRSRRPGLSL